MFRVVGGNHGAVSRCEGEQWRWAGEGRTAVGGEWAGCVGEAHSQRDLLLCEWQGAPHGHLDLLLDEVDAGHHLRDRVLHLQVTHPAYNRLLTATLI